MKKCSFLLVLVILIFCCSSQKESPKGKSRIQVIDGVKIIHNSKEGMWQHQAKDLNLEPNLVIGINEDDENYILYEPVDIDADSKGNIYILDIKASIIKKYDSQGKYVKTIGRKGEGPGDLLEPLNMFIDFKDIIYVNDAGNKRISIFDEMGEFLHSFKLKKYLDNFSIDKNGNFITEEYAIDSDTNPHEIRRVVEINKYSPKFEFLSNLFRGSYSSSQILNIGDQYFTVSVPYVNKPYWAIDPGGNICIGSSEKYVINVFDPNEKLIMKIIKDCNPSHVTNEDKNKILDEAFSLEPDNEINRLRHEQIRKKLKFPNKKPVLGGFIFDERGYLLVGVYEKCQSGFQAFDLFDEQGRYLKKLCLSSIPMLFKNGNAYGLSYSSTSIQAIRYCIIDP